MLHINLICIGKLKETYLKDAIQEYSKRLSKYYSFQIIEFPDEKLPDTLNPSIISQIQDIESEKIIAHIPKNSYIISLDLTGKQYTSEEFSEKIENIKISNSNLTFIIGGSLGLNSKLKSLSNESGEKLKGDFIFSGSGYGHGVGLSQSGARGMAEAGYGYKKIIMHYFTGVEVH